MGGLRGPPARRELATKRTDSGRGSAASGSAGCTRQYRTGISGGGTFAIAIDVASQAEPGTTILCMLPDTGERYLTTPLFESIAEDMTEEEIVISKSTPNYQMA